MVDGIRFRSHFVARFNRVTNSSDFAKKLGNALKAEIKLSPEDRIYYIVANERNAGIAAHFFCPDKPYDNLLTKWLEKTYSSKGSQIEKLVNDKVAKVRGALTSKILTARWHTFLKLTLAKNSDIATSSHPRYLVNGSNSIQVKLDTRGFDILLDASSH